MQQEHYLHCEAPICNDDPNPHYKTEVIWLPGELVCKRQPYQKFQIVQHRINKAVKAGTFRDINKAFTAQSLEESYH